MPAKIKRSFEKDYVLPFTAPDIATEGLQPPFQYMALDVGSIAVTSGRYDHKVAADALAERRRRMEGSGRVTPTPSEIRWGKVLHDIVVPTRLLAAGTLALTLQVKKGELAVDMMKDWSSEAKFAAKAPIWVTRQTLAATTALLHLPELVTMPVARGMKASLDEIMPVARDMKASLDEIREGLEKHKKKEIDTRDVMSREHGGLKPNPGGLSR